MAEMAEIMSNDASLKIKLVGHTDGIELGGYACALTWPNWTRNVRSR